MTLISATKALYINKKGSFTVEASIVFSVIFLLLAAIVYIFIIMYQYAFLQSAADQAANVGVGYYCNQYSNSNPYDAEYNFNANVGESNVNGTDSNLNSNIEGSNTNTNGTDPNLKSNYNLYWRMFDKEASYKKNLLNNYVSKKLEKTIIDSNTYSDNSTSYKFLLKQININIEAQYPLPIGNLFEIFGLPSTINIKAESNSPLSDNAEFVRNLDTVTDIKKCISNSDNKWVGKDSKVNDVLAKLLK